MSNVTIFNPSQVPDFVRNRTELSAVAKALAGHDAAPRISIKGGVFRLVKGGKEITSIDERYLDVVIVNASPKVNRVFYMKKYDGDATTVPDCWSADGDKPAETCGAKQADTCGECKQNISGSGEGDSRACRFQQQLAVVLANDLEGDVLNLSVPAKSLFGKEEGDNRPLQAYARFLTAQNVDPAEVITRMKFDTSAESPKLFWKAMRWLTNDEFEISARQGKSKEATVAVTISFSAAGNGAAVSKPVADTIGERPAREKPAARPEPQEEQEPPAPPPKKGNTKKAAAAKQEEEAPPPEPTVRKQAEQSSAVPSKKSSLASMVDDWDNED